MRNQKIFSIISQLIVFTNLTFSVQGAKRSERLNMHFCCVTFNRRTSSTPHSSALQKCIFSSFRLFDLCHRNFVHFQGRRWRRTGRTPTEDNVENGQNYMAEAFGPLYTEGTLSEQGHTWLKRLNFASCCVTFNQRTARYASFKCLAGHKIYRFSTLRPQP